MREQYDAFAVLLGKEGLNMNWTFDSLFSYMKKVANRFHIYVS